jgi:multidrug efflux pump subunit AcrA (membrane-fusion protein)
MTKNKLVIQDQGTVKYNLGQVESAKVQLSYCYISSPISGRVGLRLVASGNLVASGTPIRTGPSMSPASILRGGNLEDHIHEDLRDWKTPAGKNPFEGARGDPHRH